MNEAESVTNETRSDAERRAWTPLLSFFSAHPVIAQYATATGIILIACMVNAVSIVFDVAREGGHLAAWKPYVWELTSWAGWAIVLVLLLPWDDKVAARDPSLPVRLLVYVLTSLVCSALHIAIMAGLRYPIHALAGENYRFGFTADNLLYEYRKDLLTFVLSAGIAALWRKGLSGRDGAIQPAAPGAEPAFLVPGKEGEVLVRAGEIDWIEAQGNYVALHVRGQERLLRQPLKEIEAKLADMAFIRTHRSALVNMRRVKGITRTELGESRVEFDNRDSAPLSASRRAEVVRALAAR